MLLWTISVDVDRIYVVSVMTDTAISHIFVRHLCLKRALSQNIKFLAYNLRLLLSLPWDDNQSYFEIQRSPKNRLLAIRVVHNSISALKDIRIHNLMISAKLFGFVCKVFSPYSS